MTMICKNVYYGPDGKKSKTYYGILETQGHEKALQAYLLEHAMYMNTKFQFSTLADLEKESTHLDSKADFENDVFDKKFFDSHIGVTKYMETDIFGAMDPEVRTIAIDATAKKQIVSDLMYDDGKKWTQKKAEKEAERIAKDEPSKWSAYRKDVSKKWDGSTDQGTIIHKVIEDTLKLVNIHRSTHNMGYPNHHEIVAMTSKAIDSMTAKEWKVRKAVKYDPKNPLKYDKDYPMEHTNIKAPGVAITQEDPTTYKSALLNPKMASEMYLVIEEALKLVKEYEAKYDMKFTIMPELHIATTKERSNLKSDSNKLLHGIIDIALVNEENKRAIVIDTKTKSVESERNYEKVMGEDPMKDLGIKINNSAKSKVHVQTSLNAELMREKGYTVDDVASFLVVGNHGWDRRDISRREWRFSSLKGTSKESIKAEKMTPIDVSRLFGDPVEIKQEDQVSYAIGEIAEDEHIFNKKINLEAYKKRLRLKATQTAKGNWRIKDGTLDDDIFVKSEKALDAAISKAYKDYVKRRASLPRDLIAVFNDNAPSKGSLLKDKKLNKALQMFSTYSKERYEIYSPVDFRLEDNPDVLVLKDKRTGEISLLSMLETSNYVIGGEENNSLYAAYSASNRSVKARIGETDIPDRSVGELNMLRMTMIAADLEKVLPDNLKGNISHIVSTTLIGDDKVQYTGLSEQLAKIDNFIKLSDDVPEALKRASEILKEKAGIAQKTPYQQNFFKLMEERRDPLARHPQANSLRKVILELNSDNYNKENNRELARHLYNYANQLKAVIGRRDSTTDNTTIITDPEYLNVMKAAGDLMDISLKTVTSEDISKTRAALSTQLTSGKEPLELMDRAIRIYEQNVRTDMTEFITEHNATAERLSNALGINLDNRFQFSDNAAFNEAVLEDPNFTEGNAENWMKLKRVEDVEASSKTRTEKDAIIDYINFVNKYVRKGLELSTGNKQGVDTMYEDKEGWKLGYLPVMSASSKTALANAAKHGDSKDVFKIIKKSAKEMGHKKASDKEEGDIFEEMPHEFRDQYRAGSGIQGSSDRRSLLGCDDEGSTIHPPRCETNLFLIMNKMMLNAAKQEHGRIVALAHMSIDAQLAAAGRMYGSTMKLDNMRTLLTATTKMRLANKFDKDADTNFGKALDTMSTIATPVLFFGSLRQMVTETASVVTNITSDLFAGAISDRLWKGSDIRRYKTEDILWATKNSDLAAFVGYSLGAFSADPDIFKSDDYAKVRDKSVYTTKPGYAIQAMAIKAGCDATFMAEVHKQGIHKAYLKNEDGKTWTYDETADPRFYVVNEDGLTLTPMKDGEGNTHGKVHDKAPDIKTDPENYGKYMMWKEHRKSLNTDGQMKSLGSKSKDGNITKSSDGEYGSRMRIPFTSKELQSIKYHVLRRFGTMDKEGYIGIEALAIGRAAGKFKRWMVQKFDTYTHKHDPNADSDLKGHWHYDPSDPDAVPEWIGEPMEGIVQSFGTMFRMYQEGVLSADNLTATQKENLSKLLADMIVLAIMLGVVTGLKHTEFFANTGVGREIHKGLVNSVGDIIPFAGVSAVAEGSALATLNMAYSVSSSAIQTIYYGATLDGEAAAVKAKSTLSIIGVSRPFIKGDAFAPKRTNNTTIQSQTSDSSEHNIRQ